MTYYYIYKITCTKGSFKDKFYFGQHTTTNLDDGYKGSGKKLQNYYKTYPNDYVKEILCFCNNSDELGKKEYEIIHPFLGNEMCLNIVEGGKQSTWNKGKRGIYSKETIEKIRKSHIGKESPIKGKHLSEQTKQILSERCSGYKWMNDGTKLIQVKPEEINNYITKGYKLGRLKFSDEHNKKISEALKKLPKEKHPSYGKHWSEEARKRLSEVHKGLQTKENHPLYNKRKIFKDNESKWININELNDYLNKGWYRKR